MRRVIKHIIKVILVFALVMCWGITLGYSNNIKRENKTINFYFENDNINSNIVSNIEEDKESISVVGWNEKSLQTATNPDLNRNVSDLKVLAIKGNSSLLFDGALLFQDDKEGCLIDTETSYKLFGSTHSIGKEITYGERKLVVRGIHNSTKSNIIVQLLEDDNEALDGLTIDGSNMTLNKIEEFKTKFGIKEIAVSGGIYHSFTKVFSMVLPIIALVLILIKVITYFFKAKRKPILKVIYISMAITIVFIFFKITKLNISIPLDMIPNKWSDFDFWSKMWKENIEKLQYVLYMKKYGIDIYNIENLIMSAFYSILTVILFVINLKVNKVKDIKELIYMVSVSIVCTFISILTIWAKFKFDVNITMLWVLYPLYICGNYFMDIHEKYFKYEKNEIEQEIKIKETVTS